MLIRYVDYSEIILRNKKYIGTVPVIFQLGLYDFAGKKY
jgi:hypothetical protein